MLKAGLFSEDDFLMARFVTDRIMSITKGVLEDYGIKFPDMQAESVDILTMHELLCRESPERSSFLVPLSVADEAGPIRFWLLTAFMELVNILTDDETVRRPGLRCEYLIVRLIEAYIGNIYEIYAPDNPDPKAFRCDIPPEMNSLVEKYRKEACEDREESGEDFSSDIVTEIRNGLADIRCWIGHPDAPDFYGEELLLEDDDYLFLDKYDEGSLYYSDRFSRLGVFQWRDI